MQDFSNRPKPIQGYTGKGGIRALSLELVTCTLSQTKANMERTCKVTHISNLSSSLSVSRELAGREMLQSSARVGFSQSHPHFTPIAEVVCNYSDQNSP